MGKFMDTAARLLARATFASAVAGAKSASFLGFHQPKTPKTLGQVPPLRTK